MKMDRHDMHRWNFEDLLGKVIHVKVTQVEDFYSGVLVVTMEFHDGKMAGKTIKMEVDTDQ